MLKRNITSELVSKFNEALLKILDLRDKGNYEEALELIDSTLKEIFRLGMKFFNSLADDNLIDMIRTNGTINADKCIIMAKLLEEEAIILEHQDNVNDAFHITLKSLNIFLQGYPFSDEECDLKHHFADIDTIIEKVSDYKLPLNLQSKIMNYYFETKKYDKAEDILFEILEDSDFNKDNLQKGVNFYSELLNHDDEDLHAGNLSREEAYDSLNALKKKL